MLDLQKERQLTLPLAARHPMLGDSVHISTVHRWRLNGIRGVKLETSLSGGRRVTTVEALQRFLAAINGEQITTVVSRDEQTNAELEADRLGI